MGAKAADARISHGDKESVFKVLSKYLRIDDRKVLDQANNAEIKAFDPRMELRLEPVQAILDAIAPTDTGARKFKPHELKDRRYLLELDKSGLMTSCGAGRNDLRWPIAESQAAFV